MTTIALPLLGIVPRQSHYVQREPIASFTQTTPMSFLFALVWDSRNAVPIIRVTMILTWILVDPAT